MLIEDVKLSQISKLDDEQKYYYVLKVIFLYNLIDFYFYETFTKKEDEKFAQVIVEDDQLSLAIGKSGQNARLAAKLTNWKIDIKSETQFRELLAASEQADVEETENVEEGE